MISFLENIFTMIPSFLPWFFPDLSITLKVMIFVLTILLFIVFLLLRKCHTLKTNLQAKEAMLNSKQQELNETQIANTKQADLLNERDKTIEEFDLLIHDLRRRLNATAKRHVIRRRHMEEIIDSLELKYYKLKGLTDLE